VAGILSDIVREAAQRFPDRTAIVAADATLTYGELDPLADSVGAGLAAAGIRAGDLVSLVLPSNAAYIVGFLGLARLGAVATGVSPRYTAAERAKVVAKASPVAAMVTDDLAEGLPADLPLLRATDARWTGLRRDGAVPPPVEFREDLPETVVFTSGTTGTPKGALFTSRQIAAITQMDTGGSWGHGGPQIVSTGLPHIGFMTKLAGYFQSGATLHVLERWRAKDVLEIVNRERVPIIGGVAAQVALLLAVPEFDTYDFSCVQGLIVGAGPSQAALIRESKARFGCGYSVRYSSTESGGLGTMTAFDAPEEETLHTVGRPRPGTDLEIRDPDTGKVLGPNEVGQICLRSPAIMAGYWNDPENTAVAIDSEGFLRTGDLGLIGADGCLRVTGRIGEMFIRGGYNVFPLEVEAVLLHHPAIANVAVVPRPDATMGEIGVAVIVPRAGHEPPSLEELRTFARESLAAYKVPEAIRVVDELPLTGMDKLDRTALRAYEKDAAGVN
jgi:acyl-CoA synthetase (AMP-forming)/AMP-acid ligase II